MRLAGFNQNKKGSVPQADVKNCSGVTDKGDFTSSVKDGLPESYLSPCDNDRISETDSYVNNFFAICEPSEERVYV